MTLSEDDIARIESIIMQVGERIRRDTIVIRDNRLSFRLPGTARNGSKAIKALMEAGLNVFSDGDLDTQENFVVWVEGAEICDVRLTLLPGALWKS